jgi:putative FmdB family regulatory protein
MPIYEYACTACGQRLEAMQKISDAPMIECPACKQPSLRKLMSAAGIYIKSSRDQPAPMCGAGACPACAIE